MKRTFKITTLFILLSLLSIISCNDDSDKSDIGLTDAESVAEDAAALEVGYSGTDSAVNVTQNVTLASSGSNGTTITWASDMSGIIAADGTVTRPAYGSGNAAVTLPATISKGMESDTKVFVLTVIKEYKDIYNLSLRDNGSAGGLIFYVNPDANTDGWKYLEAAPNDQDYEEDYAVVWGCWIALNGAEGTAIGTGERNTIEFGCTTIGTAAYICVNLILGGYSDWFLPSKDELNLMYTNLRVNGLGGFVDLNYWSSSEVDTGKAWLQYFLNGNQIGVNKTGQAHVRPARAF